MNIPLKISAIVALALLAAIAALPTPASAAKLFNSGASDAGSAGRLAANGFGSSKTIRCVLITYYTGPACTFGLGNSGASNISGADLIPGGSLNISGSAIYNLATTAQKDEMDAGNVSSFKLGWFATANGDPCPRSSDQVWADPNATLCWDVTSQAGSVSGSDIKTGTLAP